MLLTPHTLVGVALGAALQRPEIAAPLSLGLHFVGDLVPHWDFYSNTNLEQRRKGWRPIAVMADLVIGVAVGLSFTLYALWVRNDLTLAITIFLSGIAAVLPDALEAPHIFAHKEPKFVETITNIQRKLQVQAPLPWGVITQLLVVGASLLVISRSLGL